MDQAANGTSWKSVGWFSLYLSRYNSMMRLETLIGMLWVHNSSRAPDQQLFHVDKRIKSPTPSAGAWNYYYYLS
jgi:hypothetical protein